MWKSEAEKHPSGCFGNPCQQDQFSLLDVLDPEAYCGLRVTKPKPTAYKNQEKGMIKNQNKRLQWFSFTCKACLFKITKKCKILYSKAVFCMNTSEYIFFLILLNYIFSIQKHTVLIYKMTSKWMMIDFACPPV